MLFVIFTLASNQMWQVPLHNQMLLHKASFEDILISASFYCVFSDTMKERPHDREQIAGLLAGFVCHSWMTGMTLHVV